ncbi:hypothetical protein GBA52_021320 [Prunus armeniaca]|nr:hypothetical protein GBA52_021320 [Prunus armeniaca]
MAGSSGCAFGNSPVVCNRCGIQIVHRQVQEHAQNCPGVQPQEQQADGALDTPASGTSATADQTQAATQSGVAKSQAQVFQITSVTPPGSDPDQKANSSSQAVVQAAVQTAEQWYQHQQQYQQYYLKNYFTYQQAAVQQSQQRHLQSHPPYRTVQHQSRAYSQSQPQTQPSLRAQLSQSQAQPQPQIQPPHVQVPVASQTQNQAQVNKQQQLHPAVQTYPAARRQPLPQPQYFQAPSHSQPHPQHVQMSHNQQAQIQQHTHSKIHPQHHPISQPQPHSQPQPQPQPQLQRHPQPHPQLHPSQHMNTTVQPQTQHPSSHAVTGNHLYPQPHLHQPVQSGAPQQRTMDMQSHGVPHSQSQTPVQIQSQSPQQPPVMRLPPSHIPNQQQPALLPSPGQIRNINPAQQQPVHSYAQQPGNTVQQSPLMHSVQRSIPRQYLHHQPYVQQQPPTQLHPRVQSHTFPLHVHAYTQSQRNIALSQGIQLSQSNLGGSRRPICQFMEYNLRPLYKLLESNMVRTKNLVHSGANWRPTMSERHAEQESESSAQQIAKNVTHDVGTASAVVGDAEVKTVKSEMDMKSIDNEVKPTGEDKTNHGETSSKEIPDIHALENGESVSQSMLNAADQNKVRKSGVARGRHYRGVRQRRLGKFTAEIRDPAKKLKEPEKEAATASTTPKSSKRTTPRRLTMIIKQMCFGQCKRIVWVCCHLARNYWLASFVPLLIAADPLFPRDGSRVSFIESDNYFIDVLLSLLTMPMGKIVRLSRDQCFSKSWSAWWGDCRPARQTYTYSPFLSKLGVVDPKATEERTFNVGVDEVVNLLMCSSVPKTPFTDMLLKPKPEAQLINEFCDQRISIISQVAEYTMRGIEGATSHSNISEKPVFVDPPNHDCVGGFLRAPAMYMVIDSLIFAFSISLSLLCRETLCVLRAIGANRNYYFLLYTLHAQPFRS